MVTTTADTGAGSLRQAILSANASGALDTIRFNLPGAGVHTIALRTELPAITRAVFLDGSTQPGFVDQPLVHLQGGNLVHATGLRLFAGASTVRSLILSGFGDTAIRLEENGGNLVVGNFLGTDASGTTAAPNGLGIFIGPNCAENTIGGTNVSARNLISGNGAGILVSAGAAVNVIQGNYVGVDRTGERALANDSFGIRLSNCVSTTVGGVDPTAGNVLSGNTGAGLSILAGASANQVQGNSIGLNPAGTRAVPNIHVGVEIVAASANTIGGSEPRAGNVISGNGAAGIRIAGPTSLGNVVQGNLIGLDAAGDGALGNGGHGLDVADGRGATIGGVEPGAGNVISGNAHIGVALDGRDHVLQSNRIGTDRSGARARPNSVSSGLGAGILVRGYDHTIGGDALGRNIISGNAADGMVLSGSNAVVQGNYIGVGADGVSALGNGGNGIAVTGGAHDNLLGGLEAGQGNIVANNARSGIRIQDANSTVVQGNWIGTAETGQAALPNHQDGISIVSPARNSLIGGTALGAGNHIAFNVRDGVSVWGATAIGHTVVGNSIQNNGALGIDLQRAGELPGAMSPNDPLDTDTGPNQLQNFPVITNLTVNAGVTIVRGILRSAPTRDYAIDFYHNAAADPSGSGQGEVYAGDIIVTTDDEGVARFTFFITDTVAERRFSATATDIESGDTSEFSLVFPSDPNPPELRITSFRQAGVRVEIEFTTTATRLFSLQRTTALGPGASWTLVPGASALVGTGGIMTAVDTNASAALSLFYRIRQE